MSQNTWGLRYPGLVMGKGGKSEVQEFTGMWPLKPDADLVAFTKALAAGRSGSIRLESRSRR